MRVSALFLLTVTAAGAQVIIMSSPTGGGTTERNVAPTLPQPETKPEDLCSIEGHVLSADGAPLKKATVVMNRTDFVPSPNTLPPSYTTTTDASGIYAMKRIEPGKYRITVTRNGYVTATYGARGPGRPGTTLTLNRAQSVKDIDFKLTPHGVVTGRIVDEDGEPVPNTMVQLLRTQYLQGRKQLTVANTATTNDLGEYRVFGLAPGKYFLSATARSAAAMASMAEDRSANAGTEEDFVPTYYPGTTDSATAAPIDVAPGAQVNGIGLTLSKARTVHVRGRVVNNAGGRGMIQLLVLPRTTTGLIASLRSNRVDARGTFDVRGVVPGSYSLYATVNDENRTYSTRMPVEVGGSNLENITLAINPGVDITGTARMENDAKQDLSNVYVRLTPREQGSILFGNMASGRLKEDNSFTLQNAGADVFNLMVTGLPDGCYVKSIRAGELDIQAAGLDLSRGAPRPIDIVISPNAGTVGGSVQNPNTNQPAQGATVVLVPQEAERRQQQEYYKTVNTDQTGAFTLKNVVPGEYKAFAWEDVEPGSYMDPDLIKGVESKGESVTVRESDRKTVTLTMIPLETAQGGKERAR